MSQWEEVIFRVETEEGNHKYGQTDGGLLTVAPEGVTLLSGDFSWKE